MSAAQRLLLRDLGPREDTPFRDHREVYGDPNAVSDFDNEQGAEVDTSPGQRWRPGDAPAGDPRTANS